MAGYAILRLPSGQALHWRAREYGADQRLATRRAVLLRDGPFLFGRMSGSLQQVVHWRVQLVRPLYVLPPVPRSAVVSSGSSLSSASRRPRFSSGSSVSAASHSHAATRRGGGRWRSWTTNLAMIVRNLSTMNKQVRAQGNRGIIGDHWQCVNSWRSPLWSTYHPISSLDSLLPLLRSRVARFRHTNRSV
jgi:hypothetical protein